MPCKENSKPAPFDKAGRAHAKSTQTCLAPATQNLANLLATLANERVRLPANCDALEFVLVHVSYDCRETYGTSRGLLGSGDLPLGKPCLKEITRLQNPCLHVANGAVSGILA